MLVARYYTVDLLTSNSLSSKNFISLSPTHGGYLFLLKKCFILPDNPTFSKPDKRSGVVIVTRSLYLSKIREIINNTSNFIRLSGDLTIQREGSIQRYFRSLKKKVLITTEAFGKIYFCVSKPAKTYGSLKTHKLTSTRRIMSLSFRIITSTIGTYKYKTAKYLLPTHILKEYCTKDSFRSSQETKKVKTKDKFNHFI